VKLGRIVGRIGHICPIRRREDPSGCKSEAENR
jgi:hypothetical protein